MPRLYNALRHIALFLLGTVMAIFGFYFAWMLAILYFKVSGRLHDGPMFHDMATPGYSGTLISLAVCAVVIGLCLLMRRPLLRGLKGQAAATSTPDQA